MTSTRAAATEEAALHARLQTALDDYLKLALAQREEVERIRALGRDPEEEWDTIDYYTPLRDILYARIETLQREIKAFERSLRGVELSRWALGA